MYKRLLTLSVAFLAGWLLWDVLRQRTGLHRPDFVNLGDQTAPSTAPVEPLPPEIIEQALETPPHVAPTDMAELAFVAAAVGIDLKPANTASDTSIKGYCVRCKAHRTIAVPHFETAKNGWPMARGTCPICGTKMVRFLKEDEVPDAE